VNHQIRHSKESSQKSLLNKIQTNYWLTITRNTILIFNCWAGQPIRHRITNSLKYEIYTWRDDKWNLTERYWWISILKLIITNTSRNNNGRLALPSWDLFMSKHPSTLSLEYNCNKIRTWCNIKSFLNVSRNTKI